MARPRLYFWALGLLVLLSCDDELGDVGFKNPNRDFDVVFKEFTIPTRVFQVDSLNTSNGFLDGSRQFATDDPSRFLVGSAEDPRFGNTTAIAYTPYWVQAYNAIDPAAEYVSLEMTLIFDYYYWTSNRGTSQQKFEVHELEDSVLTYKQHFSDQAMPYGRLLGEAEHIISPDDFDENILENNDGDATTILDSLDITIAEDYGQALFAAAKDTLGSNENNFIRFRNFRRNFKGFAFTSPNSDKIVGFNPHHTKTRLVLNYKQKNSDGVAEDRQLFFYFSPSQTAVGVAEHMSYTQFITDRTGTALAALPEKYVDYEPTDGMRYIQSGTGIMTKLDFSEVYEYFKTVPTKALSVAELRIDTEEQPKAPSSFKMRVLRPDNREQKSSKEYRDAADDPYQNVDYEFAVKHLFEQNYLNPPFLKCDVIGDDAKLLFINRVSKAGTGTSTYVGYLTNYMQQELSLSETDFLRYYELIPLEPDIAHSVNGLYFAPDQVKLRIYYTTQRAGD